MKMKRFLHILLVAILAVACTQELIEPQDEPVNDGKVTIGFNISLPEPDVATKAMADQPGGQLKTLHLAIFDEVGYLLEYVQATPTLAQTDGTRYGYTATISLSNTTRIIHFIGNGPAQLRFGDEAKVMASVKSTGNEDLYWYRKEIPSITGGGTPFGPTDETRKQFRDIPLIRNFVKVVLKDNADKFALKSYAVVNTLNSGMLAAYNSRTADFVEYFEGAQQKHYSDLIAEGYDGNIPVGATFTTVGDTWSKAVNHDQPYFVYEREKPVDNPSYIIAYGTYAGKDQYYKINLRDNNGNYFPLLRNFEYTITLTEVERGGYDSPEKAAASTGSGDISSAIETSPLVYISDGIASLEVGYTEKVLTTDDPVYWPYEFYEDIAKKKLGSSSAMYLIVNNDSGATGDAIALINRKAVTKGNRIAISANPDSILVTPTVPASTPKTQTMSLYAEYTPTDKTVPVILQRTVKYIVMTKRTMQVECIPSEVPEKRGSEFDLAITIPGGLPMSMFPLRMLIEADKLSITPNNDHMPVETGLSLIDGKKTQSAFHFIKTLDWSDYDPLQPSTKLLCHFKTNKDISETAIHVFNEYFNPAQTYLDNYQFKEFTDLSYNGGATSILAGTGRNVTFEFKMPEIFTVDEVVQPVEVALANLEPNEEDYPDELKFNNSKGVYEYIPSTDTADGKQTLHLKTINSETVNVELNSYHYLTASLQAPRRRGTFDIYFTQGDKTVETLNSTESQEVTLNFDMSYYEDGMIVNVLLDGFIPVDDELKEESGSFTYEPNPKQATGHTIRLKTVKGAAECKVRLSIKGMSSDVYEWGYGTLSQRDKIIISIPQSAYVRLGTDRVNTIRSITIANGTVQYADYDFGTEQDGSWFRPTTYYTVAFTDLVFEGKDINDDTEVTIVASQGNNGTQRTYTTTIGALRGN